MITANEAKYISDRVKRDKKVIEEAIKNVESLIRTSAMAGAYSTPCIIEKSQESCSYICDELIRIFKENGYLLGTIVSMNKIVFEISWR